MSVQVYIAASLVWKRAAAAWAEALRATGVETCSSWHDDDNVVDDDSLDEAGRQSAIRRITADVSRADCLVVLAHLGEPRATFVEAGMAIAMGKPCVFVHLGPVGRQVFDSHPRSIRVDIGERGRESARPHVALLHDAVREAVLL